MSRALIIALSLASLAGCAKTDSPPKSAEESLRSSPSRLAKVPMRFERMLMGTPFVIQIADPIAYAQARRAAQAAFAEIKRIEMRMSEWIADSEVSSINRSAGGPPTRVSPETMTLLKAAQIISQKSDGAFDITWAAFKGLWSLQKGSHPPPEAEIRARGALVGWRNLILDEAQMTASLTLKGSAIGLGGIAKGYAIDQAANVLSDSGVERFLIDGGGDLYGLGLGPNEAPWRVGVQHPRNPKGILTTLPIDGVAVVSSGDYERYFDHQGVRYHHIIDVRTGYPARESVAVTIQAKNAMMADALATAAFVLGPKAGLALINSTAGAEGVILVPDGSMVASDGFDGRFPRRWDHR